MKLQWNEWEWERLPKHYECSEDAVTVTTSPHTDLWQRTYYHFRNDNAPVFQTQTEEKYFSFTVRCEFDARHRFDQCGIVIYLDSENWCKASIEYENERFGHLGSVVTNHGYSDWATTTVDAGIRSIWYRLSRREDDYRFECSEDGITFRQMRVFHLWNGAGSVRFGVYACSPEDSSFTARFSDFEISECAWPAHDGQPPDAP
ncbi:MAG: DUF1349 domain-containing protein [Clostridia bacterium]|nr:DUF1349 domain-containing protein [Clostridia bacterium]